MFTHLADLGAFITIVLVVTVFLALFFEFINGFHDTANAVATVIYTNAMRPWHAVGLSALCNFLGVVTGGLAVAYSIVNLLPMDLLASGDNTHVMGMIFAILISAIAWNFGTWFLGIPASSSHTLIGAIIGTGMTHALLVHNSATWGVNWSSAIGVGLSLLLSPLFGFILAYFMLVFTKRMFPMGNIHETPYIRSDVKGKKHPPFWTRLLLVVSSAGVSFAHGSNDGQKGVGLVMLALISIIPSHYVINMDADRYQIERAVHASEHLVSYVKKEGLEKHFEAIELEHAKHVKNLDAMYAQKHAGDDPKKAEVHQLIPANKGSVDEKAVPPSMMFHCDGTKMQEYVDDLKRISASKFEVPDMTVEERWTFRRHLLCMESFAQDLQSSGTLDKNQSRYISEIKSDFTRPIEYAPVWVIVAIALSLGLGTMVGWKRVVKTIGEGIGRSHMTYSQGVCAQITTSVGIAAANLFGLPVSTTQVLSSAVAGTAVANKSGLQGSTVRNILVAWLLTFPVAMVLGGVIYYVIYTFLA